MKTHVLALLAGTLLAMGNPLLGGDFPDASKMNVLFINIEDCSADAWGCYGNAICKTPNIDRFAATAVRFDSAYCQAVCCNPSRTSFLTGLRPLSTRVLSNAHVMNEYLPAGVLTLPEIIKSRECYTVVVGKLFQCVKYAQRQLATFNRIEMYDRPSGWKGPAPILQFPPLPKEKRDEPPSKDYKSKAFNQWRIRHSDRYGDSGLTREQERDYRMARTAVALIEQFAKDKRRFFLALSQTRPHTPLVAPKQYIDMYDPAEIPDPPAQPEQLRGFPYMRRATGRNPDIFIKQRPTPRQAKEAIAAFYACVNFVDDNLGMVFDALERTGLDENTIVVFFADHGFHRGDHGCWSKYTMLEQTRRVPLIVRVPGASANGKVCREFVECVDLLPTLGELLQLELPGNLEGTSFVPLLSDPNRPWKRAVFMVDCSGGQMVRTREYSYLELNRSSVRKALYDLKQDPWETVNVIDDVNYAEARKEMAELLRDGWKAALPPSAAASTHVPDSRGGHVDL